MDLSRLGQLSGQTNSGDQRAQDLLAQIQDLLQQYLSLGGDTPVAGEAQQLSDAIDANMGGTSTGMDTGGPPPTDTGGSPPIGNPDDKAPVGPADEMQPLDQEPQGDVGSYQGGGMAGARAGAEAFLKKQNKKGQGKAA